LRQYPANESSLAHMFQVAETSVKRIYKKGKYMK
jgi:hypothetical protein